MSASTQSVGSLVIDIRADLAQLQADMNSVKDTIAKSSRQISSQMSRDMMETRQTLSLLRDDIGIGIPRELAKVIASSATARTAIMAMSEAFVGLAFINLGVEAFNKINGYLEKSAKQAEEEAKNTRDIANAAQLAVIATQQRQQALELIGKGEEERHALETKFLNDELAQQRVLLASAQAQLAVKLADMNLKMSFDPGTINTVTGEAGPDAGLNDDARREALEKFNKDNKDLLDQVSAAQKAIDDILNKSKSSDDQFVQYERGLDLARVKNWQDAESNRLAATQETVQKLYQAGQMGLDQELMALRTNATQRYQLEQQALVDRLNILKQDPGRNQEKLEEIYTQLQISDQNYQKTLTDISAQGIASRKAEFDAELKHEQEGLKAAAAIIQNQALPGSIFAGIGAGPRPGEGQGIGDFMSAQVDRLTGSFKDGAAAANFLEKALQDSLTPEQEFQLKSAEINAVWQQLKGNSPNGSVPADVISALNRELLLANPDFQKLKDASTEFGKDLTTELDNLILKGESFHDFLKNIITDLAEIILKATLLNSLGKFFSGGGSGTGGFVGFLGHLLGFADGGSPPVGQVSLVGENGPELFVPSTSGTIIPNSKLGGMGGPSVVIQYLDARGADAGVEQRIQRGMSAAMQQAVQSSVAAQIELSRRT